MHAESFSAEVVADMMEDYHQHCREREQADKLEKQLKEVRAILKKVKP